MTVEIFIEKSSNRENQNRQTVLLESNHQLENRFSSHNQSQILKSLMVSPTSYMDHQLIMARQFMKVIMMQFVWTWRVIIFINFRIKMLQDCQNIEQTMLTSSLTQKPKYCCGFRSIWQYQPWGGQQYKTKSVWWILEYA